MASPPPPPPPPVLLIVTLSLAGSVVIDTLSPAINVKVSPPVFAVTVFCVATAKFP